MKLIYLGSPYSHKDLRVMNARYLASCAAAAQLMEKDAVAVFAPIAHSHPISDYMETARRTDFDFWMSQDLPVLERCDELWVLMLDGWKNSRGLTREIEFAHENGIPIVYIDPVKINIIEEDFIREVQREFA